MFEYDKSYWKVNDEAWVKKQLASYISARAKKIKANKTHETQDARIKQLSGVLAKFKKDDSMIVD